MKRQLEYFTIEGAYGGNQDWFTNIVMHIGGCAAAAACDSCIYFALRKGMDPLYPYDKEHLTIRDYKAFSMKMKPYLKPRKGGVDRLELYIEGVEKYLQDIKEEGVLRMKPLQGDEDAGKAAAALREQIDRGFPVPFLLLQHKEKKEFEDFIWHWFMLTGYEEVQGTLYVTAATYGEAAVLDFAQLWNTGLTPKGGMVLYSIPERQ